MAIEFRLWSSTEEAKVRRLFKAGLTHEKIAKQMPGRSAKSIMYKCNFLGLCRVVEKNWTKTEEKRVLAMRIEGFSLEEIAKKLDRTKTSVKVKLCRLRKEI